VSVERKARVGADYMFIWVAPRAVSLVASLAPQLTLYEPGESTPFAGFPLSLVQLRADEAITSINDDLKRLVAPGSTVLGSRGAAGKYGAARLITEGGGVFPVHVSTIADGEITLSERIPRQLPASSVSGSQLSWSTWTAALPSAVTAEQLRGWRWRVVYDPHVGDDIFSPASQTDSGLLHVVHNPFDTGLTHEQLVEWFPQVTPLARSGSQDFSPAMELSFEMLVSKIRSSVVGGQSAGNEDRLEGSDFRRIHALFTCADLIEHAEPDQARSHRAKAYALLDERMQNLSWVDSDGDGVVDSGETDKPVRRRVAGGFISSYTSVDRLFSSRRVP